MTTAPGAPNAAAAADDSPFRVLGIALVAEEVGKGARLVFRYPAVAPPLAEAGAGGGPPPPGIGAERHPPTSGSEQQQQQQQDAAHNTGAAGAPPPQSAREDADEAADLFFSLPDRTVAKLFRPKPALCGQPMTLSVGGTVFCCRAVELRREGGAAAAAATSSVELPPDGASASAAAASAPNQLVLFSVIVALSPARGYSRTFRDGDDARHQQHQHRSQSPPKLRRRKGKGAGAGDGPSPSAAASSSAERPGGGNNSGGLGSASFRAIRRVHVSLSRLCRVLQREERRCAYVSVQSAAFLRIAAEIRDQEPVGGSSSATGSGGRTGAGGSGGGSGGGGGGSGTDSAPSPGGGSTAAAGKGDGEAPAVGAPLPASKHASKPRHVRMGSNATAISIPTTPMTLSMADRGVSTATDASRIVAVDHSSTGIPKSGGGGGNKTALDKRKAQEVRQSIIELALAYSYDADKESSALPDDGGLYSVIREGQCLIYGNLARELAQCFHALSRNDGNTVFFPTPSSLLSSRDGIVYINRHIAVPIEPASGFGNAADCFGGVGLNRGPTAYDLDVSTPQAIVRPYHTLLFPHAPPAELAKSMSHDRLAGEGGTGGQMTSTFHNHRLQRLLLMANPSKSLADIAVDAALSVPVTLQLASYLVESGTCTLAHVATRSARYAVSSAGIDLIRSLALPFSQAFGRAVPIFLAVAALTSSGANLGEILASASSGTDEHGIGARIASLKSAGRVGAARQDQSQPHQPPRSAAAMGRPRGGSLGNDMLSTHGPGQTSDVLAGASADDIEDELYDMCLWLRAHGVIIELREYLTQIEPAKAHAASESGQHTASGEGGKQETGQSAPKVKSMSTGEFLTSWNSESKVDKNNASSVAGESQPSQEEIIFRELVDIGDCLTGTISSVALQWKYGLDSWRFKKLKGWGILTGKLAVTHRVPHPGDDWE